jgi:DNA-binding NarL/FixJ family response regulator
VITDKNGVRYKEKRPLESYFSKIGDKPDRNEAVFQAYMDGHTQKSISRYLSLSDVMISIIVKKFRI